MNENVKKEYFKLLQGCSLFNDIPEKSYTEALKYLRAKKRLFKRGEIILQIGDEFIYAGLVLKGVIECSFQDSDFNKFNMNHFSEGNLFGETMACSEVSQSPMQISAVTDCAILFLDYRVFYDVNAKYEYKTQLAVNLIRNFSKQNLFLNQKVRILSQKDLRRKVLIYLNNLSPDERGIRKLPFSKTAWAEFLCANRTALSRELSRMVNDEILTMKGRNFILHN
ncbi:MAG: Crp/Fnr family transcriptional regulator [Synergistaceae bacterium]|nr:Crp/Fnr family transcriptional regulator [Synergistaceae bacterium]